MASTSSSTTILLEAQAPDYNSEATVTMTLRFASGAQEPCVTRVSCAFCRPCDAAAASLETYAYTFSNLTTYATSLEYHCGLGREFVTGQGGSTVATQNMTCQWNQTWSPTSTLSSCTCKRCSILDI